MYFSRQDYDSKADRQKSYRRSSPITRRRTGVYKEFHRVEIVEHEREEPACQDKASRHWTRVHRPEPKFVLDCVEKFAIQRWPDILPKPSPAIELRKRKG